MSRESLFHIGNEQRFLCILAIFKQSVLVTVRSGMVGFKPYLTDQDVTK